jgi:hypothetical protein
MGQTQSGLHPTSTGIIIEFVSAHEASRGTHSAYHMDFKCINILKEVRNEIGPKIKGTRISLVIKTGTGFVDDDTLKVHLLDFDIKNAWAGYTIEGIRVEGAFSPYTTMEAKLTWWENVQKLITRLGLTVEPDVGLVNLTSFKSNTGLTGTGPIDKQYLVYVTQVKN